MPETISESEKQISPELFFTDNDRIIVIAASAGGLQALTAFVGSLPEDFATPIFIVWHMASDIRSILPQLLNKCKKMPAANATDNELIMPGRIYTAPPDHHMLIENDRVRISRGPKENRFRPAADPLFRSAAFSYGPRVIGIVLSGLLDDGSAGLFTIKQFGGTAIVQDPADAEMPAMPENALKAVIADFVVPADKMAEALAILILQPVTPINQVSMEARDLTKKEIRIAMQDNAGDRDLMLIGELTPYACPECHGVLSSLKEGERMRFRCHTGHAYSADTLLSSVTEKIEDSLWGAIRGIDESLFLLNQLGDHLAGMNRPQEAAKYFQKANEAEERAKRIRDILHTHEQLNEERLLEQGDAENSAESKRATG